MPSLCQPCQWELNIYYYATLVLPSDEKEQWTKKGNFFSFSHQSITGHKQKDWWLFAKGKQHNTYRFRLKSRNSHRLSVQMIWCHTYWCVRWPCWLWLVDHHHRASTHMVGTHHHHPQQAQCQSHRYQLTWNICFSRSEHFKNRTYENKRFFCHQLSASVPTEKALLTWNTSPKYTAILHRCLLLKISPN